MAKRPTAAIYFSRHSNEMAKDLADRVRNDGPKTVLVWGEKFRSEKDIEEEAGAVIIQRSLANSSMIAAVYEQFAGDVEIHFVTDDGEFEEEAAPPGAGTPAPHPRAAQPEPEPPEPEAKAADEQPATTETENPHEADEPGQARDAGAEAAPIAGDSTAGGTPA